MNKMREETITLIKDKQALHERLSGEIHVCGEQLDGRIVVHALNDNV